MPTVPLYGTQQVKTDALPNVKVTSDAPLEAFGGGQGLAQVGKELQTATDSAISYQRDQAEKANQLANLDTYAKVSDLTTKLQIQGSQLRGEDAMGAPELVQKGWKDGMDEISKGITNDAQRVALQHIANHHWNELNRSTQLHVAGQMDQMVDDKTKAAIDNSRNAATLNSFDDTRVNNELLAQTNIAQSYAQHKGWAPDSPQAQSFLQSTLSNTHQDVIQAKLDGGQVDGAAQYLNENKDEMTAGDLLHTTQAVNNAQMLGKSMAVYNQVRGFTLSDGSPDEAAMESKIMAMDVPDAQKMQFIAFTKARAGEDAANQARRDSASDRAFSNAVIQARQGGQDMATALKLVSKYGSDSTDQAAKAEFIRKTYAPPTDTDPHTAVSLWEGVQDGNVNKKDIESAFMNGRLSNSTYESLNKDLYKSKIEGNDPMDRSNLTRIKDLVRSNVGNDKEKQDSVMFEVMTKRAQGASPDQLYKYANDLFKSDTNSGWIFHPQQWKTDAEKIKADSLDWGQAHDDVGKDVVDAIGAGLAAKGGKAYGPSDYKNFASQFGGVDQIKIGTPANNAMQYLIKNNQLVTPANVKAVLDYKKARGQ